MNRGTGYRAEAHGAMAQSSPSWMSQRDREEGGDGQLLHTPTSNTGTLAAFIPQKEEGFTIIKAWKEERRIIQWQRRTPTDPILCTENADGDPSAREKKTEQPQETHFDSRVQT